MHIVKKYITNKAMSLLNVNSSAKQASNEIIESVQNMAGQINNSQKHINGVVPIKTECYNTLLRYGWTREKPLEVLSRKGGPIDVYKEFFDNTASFRVGIEFETGNISSAHRAMNKLFLGILHNDLDLGILILPVAKLTYYLTDRISNYEELEPYFCLAKNYPLIFIGFDAESYSPNHPILKKGTDGMSLK